MRVYETEVLVERNPLYGLLKIKLIKTRSCSRNERDEEACPKEIRFFEAKNQDVPDSPTPKKCIIYTQKIGSLSIRFHSPFFSICFP
jgi:hypothetical protein